VAPPVDPPVEADPAGAMFEPVDDNPATTEPLPPTP